METEKINKTHVKNIILTFVYALFTLLIVLHHEIWADEAQVWMIAKNVSFWVCLNIWSMRASVFLFILL